MDGREFLSACLGLKLQKARRLIWVSIFELDRDSGELFKQGRKVKLHGQRFELLAVSREGQRMVARSEVMWPQLETDRRSEKDVSGRPAVDWQTYQKSDYQVGDLWERLRTGTNDQAAARAWKTWESVPGAFRPTASLRKVGTGPMRCCHFCWSEPPNGSWITGNPGHCARWPTIRQLRFEPGNRVYSLQLIR